MPETFQEKILYFSFLLLVWIALELSTLCTVARKYLNAKINNQ